jgi:hypothetical protein
MIPYIKNRCVLNVPRECLPLFLGRQPFSKDVGLHYVIARPQYNEWQYSTMSFYPKLQQPMEDVVVMEWEDLGIEYE